MINKRQKFLILFSLKERHQFTFQILGKSIKLLCNKINAFQSAGAVKSNVSEFGNKWHESLAMPGTF